MKTKNAMKFFAAATIVVAGLTACAGNENPVDPESFASTTPSGDQAEETTYATFTFNFNDDDDSATRALMLSDEYEPDPPVINDIRLLFFRGSDNAPMLDTMFTFGSDPASPVTVPMYSGTKRIFVIANSAGKTHITNLLPEGLSYSNVQSLYDIGSGTPPTALDFSELVKTSSSSRSMVYSSSTKESNIDARPGIGAAESQHPSSDNYYAITLRRLVAKVTVGLESASVQNLADGSGKVQNLKYSIRNVNRSLYLFQNYNASNVLVTPYGDAQPSSFANYYYRGYDYSEDVLLASASSRGFYVTENVPTTASAGNITYAAIEAVYLPAAGYYVSTTIDYSAARPFFSPCYFSPIAATTDLTVASDLYRFKNTVSVTGLPGGTLMAGPNALKLARKVVYHLLNPTVDSEESLDAAAYSSITDAQVANYFDKYTDGKTYFTFYIGEQPGGHNTDIDYGIKRNHHYKVNISSISGGIGAPVEEDFGIPLGGGTYITASVIVEPYIIDYIVGGI